MNRMTVLIVVVAGGGAGVPKTKSQHHGKPITEDST